jgi:predicted XRE-type DNA-binding protein
MSRNPFLDLGFPPEEAAALHIRSQLAATLEYHIERKGWSQAEAARALKVPQPTVSKIVSFDRPLVDARRFRLRLSRPLFAASRFSRKRRLWVSTIAHPSGGS